MVLQGTVDNWRRQSMMTGFSAGYDRIAAFSETDFAGDLTKCDMPAMIIHGDDERRFGDRIRKTGSGREAWDLRGLGTRDVYRQP